MVVNPGATILLSYQAEDKETGLTITCSIYKNDGTVLSTPTMTHKATGLYLGTTTINDEGSYTAVFTPDDTNYSTEAQSISVQHSWRPSFGAVEATVDPKQIALIVDPLKEWLKRIEKELKQKSEFDPVKQKVKTDIPPVSFRMTNEKIDNLRTVIQQVSQSKDYTKQIEQIKSQIIKEIQSIPKVDLAIVLEGIERIKKGQIDQEFRSKLVKAVTNLADKQALVQRDVKDIPKTDSREKLLEITKLINSLDTAKPQDITRLSTLLSQFQTNFQQNISNFEQLLEVFNQATGERDQGTKQLLNQIIIELRRISSFKEDNKNIFNRLDNL